MSRLFADSSKDPFTCTGSPTSVGNGKKQYLTKEFGEGACEMMRTLKRALDPKNILNPAKVVDV